MLLWYPCWGTEMEVQSGTFASTYKDECKIDEPLEFSLCALNYSLELPSR